MNSFSTSRTPKNVPAIKAAEPSSPSVAKPVALTKPDLDAPSVRPPVSPGRMKSRHFGVLVGFLLLVVIPTLGATWYLWTRAADQYASTVAFSVRTERSGSAIELLGGITNLAGSSTEDADILYEFIQSQRLVADIDQELDLRALWSWPENDPIFVYDAPGTIEDLVEYWKRMVRVSYDTTTNLIEVRSLAFRPADAMRVSQAIYDHSSTMINGLSDIAQEDAIRYARDELDTAIARLKTARTAVTKFRNVNQIVDPAADLQSQVGLLGTLNVQLAEALIEQGLLTETTQPNDPRVLQNQRRIRVIENQIAQERRKLGIGSAPGIGDEAFAYLVGEYESLVVDREFAERSYTAALTSYDAALAEARRQSRYLAAHILPTLSEKSQYPQREMILALISLFLFLLWSILTLIYYSLKDRR